MKLLYVLLAGLCLSFSLKAQVTNEGEPKSWKIETTAAIDAVKMPEFDLEKLLEEDRANSTKKDMPFRFGHEFITDYAITNSGDWQTLANGDRIWRMRFYSEGAKTMNFVLSNFYLPEGSTLYLYNNERTDVLGAYTSSQNSEERVLGTWLIGGEDIWIEYYEPKQVKNQGSFTISKVVHGYRSSNDFIRNNKGLNDSGNCNQDVNCPIGSLDNLKDINKKAVGLIIVGNSGFCSGALVNNTSNNGTPYFLTANHCVGSVSGISQWAFRFNWVSVNTVCAQSTNSISNNNYYQTISGASLRARRAQSDFCLVQITSSLPQSWDVVYAGWDRTTNVPSSTFGIHHPAGDIMKVCRDDNQPTSLNTGGQNVWRINNWDLGVTEGGSSGSPLFNNNGRIIGQLFGGDADCNGTTDNGGYDEYGRFNISWEGGFSPSSRLKEWLDPNNTGATILDYYGPNLGTANNSGIINKISVYPNPSNGVFTLSSNVVVEGTYEIYNPLGQIIKAGRLTAADATINLSSNTNGIYFVKVKDSASGNTQTIKLIKE